MGLSTAQRLVRRTARLTASVLDRIPWIAGVRVIMYHSIGGSAIDDISGTYTLSKQLFNEHLTLLKRLVRERSLVSLPLGAYHPRGVTLTFDDGYCDSAEAAFAAAEDGLFVTMFVIAQRVDSSPEFLSTAQLRDLAEHPRIQIGGHGVSHHRLSALSIDEVRQELETSRSRLTTITGKDVTCMSYPHGSYNTRILTEVARAGFRFAATSETGFFRLRSHPLEIPRLDIWAGDSPHDLLGLLRGSTNYLGWRSS